MGEAEGEECDQARLSTPDRQLEDRSLATGAEVFKSCGVGLALGVPELDILINFVLDRREEVLDRPACPHPRIEVVTVKLPGLADLMARDFAGLLPENNSEWHQMVPLSAPIAVILSQMRLDGRSQDDTNPSTAWSWKNSTFRM